MTTNPANIANESGGEPRFPFTAIVGQRAMKRALILNAVNTRIGGVLIRGKKGTAKSTAVRSLAALLPEVTVLRGCPYSCPPDDRQGLCAMCQPDAAAPSVTRQVRIVDLPVGATEDRLVGSLDIEQALKTGRRSFEPGLIAATHRGILYVDEVNLLNDHLVDVLLDAAAMGRNYVEREGVSVSHAAQFILVGTMNPEEGDLRPQLLDRFGLAVEVDSDFTIAERQEVVQRRIAYETDPYGFMAQWQDTEAAERERISRSRELLARVVVSGDILELIAGICAEYQVDGLRADIVMYKTAATIAAYEGRESVAAADVREAAAMALLHRQRRQPFQQPRLETSQLDAMIDDFQNRPNNREPSDGDGAASGDANDGGPDSSPPDGNGESGDNSPDDAPADSAPGDEYFEIGDPFAVRPLPVKPPDRRARPAGGRRADVVSGSPSGRYVAAAAPRGKASDLALDATLRAAAPHQPRRRDAVDDADSRILIEPWDIREKVRETKTGSLVLFVVDASGSMGAQRRMVAVKGAIPVAAAGRLPAARPGGANRLSRRRRAAIAAADVQRRPGPRPAASNAHRRPHTVKPRPAAGAGGNPGRKAQRPQHAAAANAAVRRPRQRRRRDRQRIRRRPNRSDNRSPPGGRGHRRAAHPVAGDRHRNRLPAFRPGRPDRAGPGRPVPPAGGAARRQPSRRRPRPAAGGRQLFLVCR